MTTKSPQTASRVDMISALVNDKFAAYQSLIELQKKCFVPALFSDRGGAKFSSYKDEAISEMVRYQWQLTTLCSAELEQAYQKMQSERCSPLTR